LVVAAQDLVVEIIVEINQVTEHRILVEVVAEEVKLEHISTMADLVL
jgi:hypothetical protein